jgi:hypothetical protein
MPTDVVESILNRTAVRGEKTKEKQTFCGSSSGEFLMWASLAWTLGLERSLSNCGIECFIEFESQWAGDMAEEKREDLESEANERVGNNAPGYSFSSRAQETLRLMRAVND